MSCLFRVGICPRESINEEINVSFWCSFTNITSLIALILASVFSIDFNPVSAEELAEAQQTVGNGSVYWTQFGKSYHLDPNCHTLMRSSKVYQGTIEEAFEANRTDPCDFCALDKDGN